MARQTSLFGNLPDIKGSKELNKKVCEKANTPKKSKTISVTGGSTALGTVISLARQKLIDDGTIELVTSEERFREYMHRARQAGLMVLDTEGDSLDPIDNNLAGIGFYYPGADKTIYVPMHHVDHNGKELPNQISDEIMRSELKKCLGIKIVYHNAKYDIRVVRQSLGLYMPVFWCTLIAANFLNENEPHQLKPLWNKYVNKGKDPDALKFSELFKGIPFQKVPLDIAHLYAGKDPRMTYELMKFQMKFLDPESELCKEKGLYLASKLLRDTELPLISYVSEIEDTGVCIDKPYAQKLSVQYTKYYKEAEEKALSHFKNLDYTKLTALQKSKLSSPINLNSPPQLSIIFYDLLKLKSPDPEKPRGTGEEILDVMKYDYPEYAQMFKDLLDYRGVAKLLSTYIDKMPKEVKEKTGRLHGSFNQYGAKTGRFSSSDPNLQNIPSHNKDIRKMFIATPGWVLLAGDYSQVEPRVLAFVSGDERLIEAYASGKDIYATIGSIVFQLPYEDCLEFKNGEENPAGKKRRDSVKSIVLGIMYGRGAQAIADQIGSTKKEAQAIIDKFFEMFPKVKAWVDSVIASAKEKGFVETVWGRKRRLPDIQLPLYEFKFVPTKDDSGNEIPAQEGDVPDHVVDYYWTKLEKAWGKDKKKVKAEARKKGIRVIDNGGKISEAERQAVNSIIQGTSADITKRAMLAMGRSKELRDLSYRMLITVHDEVIGECPKENALKAREIIKGLMLQAADRINIPMKVDFEINYCWYGDKLKDEDLVA